MVYLSMGTVIQRVSFCTNIIASIAFVVHAKAIAVNIKLGIYTQHLPVVFKISNSFDCYRDSPI